MRQTSQSKILLLEDDRFYALFLKQYLEQVGFAVIEAGSLLEFKTLLPAEQPDALISDVGFAEGSGPTARYLPLGGMMALDWLAQQTGLRKPRVTVIVSATMNPGLRRQFEALQVTAIFEKPFEPGDLIRTLRLASLASV